MSDVIWRPQAQAALYHVIGYIAEQNPVAARRLLHRILESMEPARIYPNFGRAGRVPGTREVIAHPNTLWSTASSRTPWRSLMSFTPASNTPDTPAFSRRFHTG